VPSAALRAVALRHTSLWLGVEPGGFLRRLFHKRKKTGISLSFFFGGEGGIRTLETVLPFT